MIHPDTEIRYINAEKGYGVVAKKLIPKGTITWVLDKLDREFSLIEIEQMEPLYKDIIGTYTFRNNRGGFVLCWDNGRYVNHSFNSNCITTAYDFEIAIRDIQPGEELTDDYGYLNITEPFDALDESDDRKTVYPDDLLKYHELWDNKLSAAFPSIIKVEQPLKSLLSQEMWQKVVNISNNKEKMDSILTCYFDESKINK